MKKNYITLLFAFIPFFLLAQTEFITTWKTNNPGISNDNQIKIPTFPGEVYNYNVDWGDGTLDSGITSDSGITHTYTMPGIYSVSITGDFPRIFFNNPNSGVIIGDEQKLLTIEQWGEIQWNSMGLAFAGCINLDIVAVDVPNFNSVSDMSFMLWNCNSLVGTSSFENWDVSNVNTMFGLFNGASLFNQAIGNWDVSAVSQMGLLFNDASSFNQDIGTWDVSNVLAMPSLFRGCKIFNQDISTWNVANVADMGSMFFEAENFNQDIGGWNVSNVIDMGGMFWKANSFNQDISNWNVGQVTNMGGMFYNVFNFNADIGGWNVSNVTSMNAMFRGTAFNQDISSWDVGNVIDMDFMFYFTKEFNQDITGWDVSNVETMINMFGFTSSFDQNLGLWDVSKVRSMNSMFSLSTGLSPDNYNNMLIGWSNLPSIQNNVQFDIEWNEYCSGENARQTLINSYGWIINDNGKNCVDGQRPFITKWKTDNFGLTNDNQIQIPVSPFGIYDYTVEWGDGTSNSNVRGAITHTYASPGVYEVKISGYFPATGFFESPITGYFSADELDREKILTVEQWGDLRWGNLNGAFIGCTKLDVVANDAPNLSNIEQLASTFSQCKSLKGTAAFNIWDVSNIKRFDNTFRVCEKFDQDISSWDMSNAENITGMFNFATSFNQDISSWDVSNVVFMGNVFNNAHAFNQDISDWDVSKVSDMQGMFRIAMAFDQNLVSWKIGNVTNMSEMFFEAGISNQNYDETLISWSSLPSLQSNVMFDAGSSQYCRAEQERQAIIEDYNWVISDGGSFRFCAQNNTAIKAYALTPSCLGSSDGSIEIISDVPGYLLDISIEGEGVSEQFVDISSDTVFEIDNLSVGLYTVTVAIPEVPFEQTYGLRINEIGSVSGKRIALDLKAQSVSYAVSGSKSYEVSVNGKQQIFSFNNVHKQTIKLENLKGRTEVIISGDNDCQGKITDNFYIGEGIHVFPTITMATVSLFSNGSKFIARLYSLDGRLVMSGIYDQLENNLDISSLESGLYLLEIESTRQKKTLKIVKI